MLHDAPLPEETQNLGEGTRERLVVAAACAALGRRGVLAAGVSEAEAGFAFARRDPPFGLLMATLSGRGQVWIGGAWRALEPGHVWLSPPGLAHAYASASQNHSEGPWRLVWATFAPEADASPRQAIWARADPEPLALAVLGLQHEAPGSSELAAGDAGTVELWAELISRHALRIGAGFDASSGRARESAHCLARAWAAVEADLKRPWSLSEVARLARVSEETLRLCCRRATGRSPMEHVAWLRMQRAAALLLRTNWTVERVALEVGYASPFTFSAAFKKPMGMAPAHFRRGGGRGDVA